LLIAVAGIVSLLTAHSVAGILGSACVVGLGLAAVYPITIAFMTRTTGREAAGVSSVMFALAGLGAACVPWLVGFESTAQSSLKLGLGVALGACLGMLVLYLRSWPGTAPSGAPETANLVH
jgi:fucose permease